MTLLPTFATTCKFGQLLTLELSILAAPVSEGLEEGSVRLEHLYPVVSRVAHDDVALVVYSHAPGGRSAALLWVKAKLWFLTKRVFDFNIFVFTRHLVSFSYFR